MNLNNIRSELEGLKKSYNVSNNTSVYDFIRRHPNNYLLLFQPYLRQRGIDFLNVKYTRDLLDCPELESYRKDFEAECKHILLEEVIKE